MGLTTIFSVETRNYLAEVGCYRDNFNFFNSIALASRLSLFSFASGLTLPFLICRSNFLELI